MAQLLLSVAVLSFIVAGIILCVIVGLSDSPMQHVRPGFDADRRDSRVGPPPAAAA